MLEFLEKQGHPWQDMSPYYKFGGLVKKKQFVKATFNPKLNAEVDAVRAEVASAPASVLFRDMPIDLVMSKNVTLESPHLKLFDFVALNENPFFAPPKNEIK
jgi:hypothetical protein